MHTKLQGHETTTTTENVYTSTNKHTHTQKIHRGPDLWEKEEGPSHLEVADLASVGPPRPAAASLSTPPPAPAFCAASPPGLVSLLNLPFCSHLASPVLEQ